MIINSNLNKIHYYNLNKVHFNQKKINFLLKNYKMRNKKNIMYIVLLIQLMIFSYINNINKIP